MTLCKDGRRQSRAVHHLVLLAFVGPKPGGMVTRHLNGDPGDNRLTNLVYGTQSENMYDKVAHGTHHEANKTHCANGHPYEGDNVYFDPYSNNKRTCRTCRRQNLRNMYARRSGSLADLGGE